MLSVRAIVSRCIISTSVPSCGTSFIGMRQRGHGHPPKLRILASNILCTHIMSKLYRITEAQKLRSLFWIVRWVSEYSRVYVALVTNTLSVTVLLCRYTYFLNYTYLNSYFIDHVTWHHVPRLILLRSRDLTSHDTLTDAWLIAMTHAYWYADWCWLSTYDSQPNPRPWYWTWLTCPKELYLYTYKVAQ